MNNEKNRQSYNKIAEKWNEYRKNTELNPYVIAFANLVKNGGSILDVGCGTGIPIDQYLVKCGFNITGVDISEKMLEKAIDLKLTKAIFRQFDFFEFVSNDKYDGLIAFDSFFHIDMNKQNLIYSKANNLLKNGGILLFTHGKTNGKASSKMFGEKFYYSALALDKTLDNLQKNGFDIIEIVENYECKEDKRDLIIIARKRTTND